ncbi:hypothetical protein FNF27_00412 [Cafeteria roenbergensis]|uniref:TmcB/TmcC TPR repeats domain-containing protein n=1 Tax=Cafeteria roenbergensis TaxID=33653 RepID=A0A5A8EKQ7_CAFRO|nr:hypothetical protein FNF27_00412 [Cafeteria roenbergensis]
MGAPKRDLEDQVDVDGIMARVQAATSGQSDGGFWKQVEITLFRIFGLMLSDSGHVSRRKTARFNVLRIILFFVDWLQLAAIMMSPSTGYTFPWEFLAFTKQLSLLRILGIDDADLQTFTVVWAVVIGIMALALANVAYVAWQVRVGFSGSLAPVRTLRAAVLILLTATYVPMISIVAQPLACQQLQRRSRSPDTEVPCWGTLHATMVAIGLPVTLAFVAFAFLMRAVYFNDAPLSGVITSKPIARNEFWDTVARTAVVLMALFLRERDPMLMTVLFIVLYSLLTIQAVLHLPYFKLSMTQLRVSTYCALVWLATGGVVIQSMRGMDDVGEDAVGFFAMVWLYCTLPVLAAGAALSWWRYRWMERTGAVIAKFHLLAAKSAEMVEDDDDVNSAHEEHGRDRPVTAGALSTPGPAQDAAPRPPRATVSSDVTPHLSLAEPVKIETSQAPSDADSNLSVHSAEAGGHEDNDEELDELLNSGAHPSSLESHASYVWSSDTDVELFVRSLLSRPTPRRLHYARALLDEALTVFPESVFVRLTFTTYLFSRTATYPDILLAIRLLAEASTMPASLDLRFAVFSKLSGAMNARRRLVLGDGQPGSRQDSLDLVEFKKGARLADEKHKEAVALMLKYWTALAHGATDGVTIRDSSVTDTVAGIVHAADAAEKAYLGVLERWPTSQQVQRAFGLFLINVRNDKELGESYLSMGENADDDLRETGGGGESVVSKRSGLRSGGSVGVGSMASGSSLVSVENLKRRRMRLGNTEASLASQLPDISRMRYGFRLGLGILLAIICGMFALSATLFGEVRLTVSVMGSAGLRRFQTHKAIYDSRGQRLAARENNTEAYEMFQTSNLAMSKKFHSLTDGLFFDGPRPAAIDKQWSTAAIPVYQWNPSSQPGILQESKMGLFAFSSLFVASAVRIARMNMSSMAGPWGVAPTEQAFDVEDGDPFFTLPAYRFVLENFQRLMDELDIAADAYQRANVETAQITDIVMFTLTGIRFVVLAAVAWGVMLPAVDAIRQQKLVLRKMLLTIPRRVAGHMASRLKTVQNSFNELGSGGSSLEELDPTSKVYGVLRDSRFLIAVRQSRRSAKRSAADDGAEKEPAAAGVSASSRSEDDKQRPQARSALRPSLRVDTSGASTGADARRSEASQGVDAAGGGSTSWHADLIQDDDLLMECHDAGEMADLLQSRRESGLAAASRREAAKGSSQEDGGAQPSPANSQQRQQVWGTAQRAGVTDSADSDTLPDESETPSEQERQHGTDDHTVKFAPTPTGDEVRRAMSPHSSKSMIVVSALRNKSDAASQQVAGDSAKPTSRCSRCCSRDKRPAAGHLSSDEEDPEVEEQLGICSNPSLRRVVGRGTIVVLVLIALMIATTIVFYTFAAESGTKASQMNNSGRRRYLACETVNLLRELMIADGQVETVKELTERLESTLALYEKVHNGLELGDEDLGLTAADPSSSESQLLARLNYGVPGSGFDPMQTDGSGIADFSGVGLDPLVRFYWATARKVLERYRSPDAPRPKREFSAILADSDFNALWVMQRTVIDSMQAQAVKIYASSNEAVVNELESQAYLILSIEVIMLAAAYLLVYEGISSALVSEHMRANDIRELIPTLIRLGTPALSHDFGGKPKSATASSDFV